MSETRDSHDDGELSSDPVRAIGKQVRLLRERAGLTRKELGDRLGDSEDLISWLERGRRTPQPEFLIAADEVLGAGGMLKAVIGDIEKAKARARRPQLGYVEAQSSGRLITDTEEVRILPARYGSLRAQALTMRESCALIETLLWER